MLRHNRHLLALFAAGLLITALAVLSLWQGIGPHGETGDGKTQEGVTPGFLDVAQDAGIRFRMTFLRGEQGEQFKINLYDHGCGVAVADFDRDGFDDVYFLNQLGPNALYRNRGDGTFVDVTRKAGVSLEDRVCVGATFADFDNDGFPDLYVTSTRGGNVLFRNMGDGTFKDVTKPAGLTLVGHSQTAVFFDFDNDGWLDLFVTNTAKWTTQDFVAAGKYYTGVVDIYDLARSPKEYNVLYRNNRDGTFSDVTERAGMKGRGWGGDVAVFDYDEDGQMDLLVTSMFGRSQLYRNNGNGTFSDVTMKALGPTSFGSIGAKVFDFNNDGRLDLCIVDMHSDMWAPDDAKRQAIRPHEKVRYRHLNGALDNFDPERFRAREQDAADLFQIRYNEVIFGNTLFKNLGNGRFVEVGEQAGLETFWPWGIATGDFDNDGHEDVFLPSGMGFPYFYWENKLLMNQGDGRFVDRAGREGIEPPRLGPFLAEKIGGKDAARSSRCAAVADFRTVGRLDIVTNNFNDMPYYFRNQFPKNDYIAFRLTGTRSNRDAIGALVLLRIGKEIMLRQVQGAGGYLSQSSRILHCGLGTGRTIDRVEIRWPSGCRQMIDQPAINQLHSIIEPKTPSA